MAAARLHERLIDRGYDLRDLEPASLYITIALPDLSAGQAHDVDRYSADFTPYLPDDFDTASYETSCAEGCGREEFDWGLYWHRGRGDGTWYRLHRISPTIDAGSMAVFDDASDVAGMWQPLQLAVPSSASSSYHLDRDETSHSPRLCHHVVGLIRVLRVPDAMARGLTPYLDWLAAHAAASATRSFIWATSLYLRTRRHLVGYSSSSNGLDRADDKRIAAGFDITGFLWEALDFAYEEVWYALAGQLPRPVVASEYGVEILLTRIALTQGLVRDEGLELLDNDGEEDEQGPQHQLQKASPSTNTTVALRYATSSRGALHQCN